MLMADKIIMVYLSIYYKLVWHAIVETICQGRTHTYETKSVDPCISPRASCKVSINSSSWNSYLVCQFHYATPYTMSSPSEKKRVQKAAKEDLGVYYLVGIDLKLAKARFNAD